MKVIATEKGYYDNHIIKEGTEFDCKEKECPVWCVPAKKAKKEEAPIEPNDENTPENDDVQEKAPDVEQVTNNDEEAPIEPNDENVSDVQSQDVIELERLKDIGTDNNILLDIPENLSAFEQVQFVKAEFDKIGIKY